VFVFEGCPNKLPEVLNVSLFCAFKRTRYSTDSKVVDCSCRVPTAIPILAPLKVPCSMPRSLPSKLTLLQALCFALCLLPHCASIRQLGNVTTVHALRRHSVSNAYSSCSIAYLSQNIQTYRIFPGSTDAPNVQLKDLALLEPGNPLMSNLHQPTGKVI